MARNKEKYLYLELAILRGSPLFDALLDDAAASGKPAALVAVQRLADYYRAIDWPGVSQPSPTIPTPQAIPLPAPSLSPQDMTRRTLPQEEPAIADLAEDDTKAFEYRTEQARANALAALSVLETWESD